MSKEWIDHWLDNELSDVKHDMLEDWLRADPEHLSLFFDTVTLEEDLAAHHRPPAIIPWPKPRPRKLLLLLAAAALALAIIPTVYKQSVQPRERPTPDPLVWIQSGDPQVLQFAPPPIPMPGAPGEPRKETRITTTAQAGKVRWKTDCQFEFAPETVLALRIQPGGPVAEQRKVTLAKGRVTVRLTGTDEAFEFVAGFNRLLAYPPAVFTLTFAGRQPSGSSGSVSVEAGSVELIPLKGPTRKISAGETVELP